MRIYRNFPRDIVHGPYSRGGLGIPDLYTTQNTSKIEILLDQFSRASITSSLLHIHLQYLILEVGIGADFLLNPFEAYGRITSPSIITSLWKFLTEENIQLHLPLPETPLLRENDVYLMEQLCQQKLPIKVLKDINQCRLYLQVVSLGDITSACGTRLLHQCLEGHKPSWLRPIHPWPDTPRPGPTAWTTWRAHIIATFGHRNTTLLSSPLGPWHQCLVHWQWFYSQQEHRLYHKDATRWVYYTPLPGSKRQKFQKFQWQGLCAPPTDLQPASTQTTSYFTTITGIGPSFPQPSSSPQTTFHQYLTSLPKNQSWAIQYVSLPDKMDQIAASVEQGTPFIVSDGSFAKSFGTGAFVLEHDEDNPIVGANVTPGQASDQSALRSELSGLYGALLVLYHIYQYFNLTQGRNTVKCDNLTAVQTALNKNWYVCATAPHWDLQLAIQHLISLLPDGIQPGHVLGHQDTKKMGNKKLDKWAELNIEADLIAGEYHQKMFEAGYHHPPIWGEGPTVHLNHVKCVNHLRKSIYNHVHAPRASEYWTKKDKLPQHLQPRIDWQAQEDALQTSSLPMKTWATKQAVGTFGNNKWMHRWGFHPNTQCPRCDAPVEDAYHVLRCPQLAAIQTWEASLQKLSNWMLEVKTDPELKDALIAHLRHWKQPSQLLTPTTLPPYLQELLQEQENIGWHNFLEGFVSIGWAEIQARYYIGIRSRRSSRQWVTALVKKVWLVAWDQWQQRNEIVHQQQQPTQRQISRLDRQIQHQYKRGTSGLALHDHYLVNRPISTLMKSFTSVKVQWLHAIQMARANYHGQHTGS